MSKLLSLLYISYPLILHLSIYFQQLSWGLYWLAVLIFISACQKLVLGAKLSATIVGAFLFSISLAAATYKAPDATAIFLPLLLYTALFSIFARTLLEGRIPLITKMACLVRDVEAAELNQTILDYTRLATQLWALFFLLMGLSSLLLGLFADLNLWSFFVNFLSYILVGVMFIFEYWLRKKLVGKQMDYTMKQYFQRMRGIKLAQVLRLSR